MFDLTHGLMFSIGSMTLIISILVIVLLIANSKKEEREPNSAEESIQKLKNLKG